MLSPPAHARPCETPPAFSMFTPEQQARTVFEKSCHAQSVNIVNTHASPKLKTVSRWYTCVT